MDLAQGDRLGPYEVLSPLGAGGMGEVYKARDTRLNRTLALKVLPFTASNEERRHRFIREAKAASSLNHPNIVHIYDIGEDAGRRFIAMEYVAGVTLQKKIGASGLAISELLTYAVGIADALATAHAAGIVHCDLKPANVMVTTDGVAKVLDFGVAKLVEPVDVDAVTRTETGGLTHDHAQVGTLAYMSPEQALGKPIDRRSDIFSFGAVLYEMATGRRAFQRESSVATLTAIIQEEPRRMTSVMSECPAELDNVVTRCLRKDPFRRFQHMDDVKVALLELKERNGASGATRDTGGARHPRSLRAYIAWVIVPVVALGAFLLWSRWPRAAQHEPTLRKITFDVGLTTDPALSRDGKLLAFASDRAGTGVLDIWVQPLPGGQPIRLTTDETDASEPAFSPDDTQIAFRSERNGGGIYVIGALGGESRLVAAKGYTPRYSPDGQWIAYWSGIVAQIVPGGIPGQLGRMFVVPATGGAPRAVRPEFSVARYPVWSPDSRHLLFVGEQIASLQGHDVDWWMTPIDEGTARATGAEQLFVERKFGRPWIPSTWREDGVLFAAQSGDSTNLWRLPMSATGQITGAPERLTFGSALEAHPSESSDSSVAFASETEELDVWSAPLDADRGRVTGPMERLTHEVSPALFSSLDRAGTRVGFWSQRSGRSRLWVLDLASHKEAELPQAGDAEYPTLSPDGNQVAYQGTEQGRWVIRVIEGLDGAARTVCTDCVFVWDWTADSRSLLYGLGSPARLAELELATGRSREITKHSTFNIYRVKLSPDGRWVAFHTTNDPSVRQIFVAPLGDASQGADAWIPITPAVGRNVMPSWSPDGRLVYYVSDRDGHFCVWAQRVDGATKHPVGDPFAVLHQHSARLSLDDVPGGPRNSVAPGRLVLGARERTGNIWMRIH